MVWGAGVGANVRRYSTTFGWTCEFEGDRGNGTTGLKVLGETVIIDGDVGSLFATNRVFPPSVANSSSSAIGAGESDSWRPTVEIALRYSERLTCAFSCKRSMIV